MDVRVVVVLLLVVVVKTAMIVTVGGDWGGKSMGDWYGVGQGCVSVCV